MPKVASGPKPPVKFSSSIAVADSALLTGTHSIVISSESVVHPRAKLNSAYGRIIVGRRCILDERCLLGASSLEPVEDDTRDGVVLGDYVTVEVGAIIESGETVIGDGCVLGAGSQVKKGAQLGKVLTRKFSGLYVMLLTKPQELYTDSKEHRTSRRNCARLHGNLF